MDERLKEIIETMDIPEQRKEDVLWLSRNMFIRNSNHEDFEEARKLLTKELRDSLGAT